MSCHCCQIPAITPEIEARQAEGTAVRSTGWRWFALDGSGDSNAWGATYYLVKTVTDTTTRSGTYTGGSTGSYSVSSTLTRTLTYTPDDPGNPLTTYSKAWSGGGSSTDTDSETTVVTTGGEGGIPETPVSERIRTHSITSTYTIDPDDGTITTETHSVYFESLQIFPDEPEILVDTDETTTSDTGPASPDDDIPAITDTEGPTTASRTITYSDGTATTTITLSGANPIETREQLIARATAAIPDFPADFSSTVNATALLTCPETPFPNPVTATARKAQWRLAHPPTPTCYLKAWPLQTTRTYPDGLPAPETDPAPSAATIDTYTWTGTGRPCVAHVHKPPGHADNRISGETHDLPVPSEASSVQVTLQKWSLLPTYTPPDDGSENNVPQPGA